MAKETKNIRIDQLTFDALQAYELHLEKKARAANVCDITVSHTQAINNLLIKSPDVPQVIKHKLEPKELIRAFTHVQEKRGFGGVEV